ncbi:unnamed protein product [Auanema sp. JU1783]|nr:unnamed protein product [Auanema sp. JU1783]
MLQLYIFWSLCLISPIWAATCTRVQACSAQLKTFPTFEEDGSGYGSGMIPLYDEVFETVPFDFSQTPYVDNFELCECAGNATCDSSIESRNMKLDETTQLTFCEDVSKQIALPCSGRRGVIRVIGPAESSGIAVASISSTLVFCNCPLGYRRMPATSWGGEQLSVEYKCN